MKTVVFLVAATCLFTSYAQDPNPSFDIECNSEQACGIYNPVLITKSAEDWTFDAKDTEKIKKFESKIPLNLKSIPDVILDTYTNLISLTLEGAGIEVLPDHHFANLDGLKNLILNSNKIRVIPSKAFEGISEVLYMEIMNNEIETVEENALSELTALELLDLSGNKIKQITASAITGATHLKFLNLNENQIENIEKGALNLPGLIGVNLRRNLLQTMPEDMCGPSPKLRYMHLSMNSLTSIGMEFDKCQNLRTLYLDNNQIETVNFTSLANLQKLIHLQLGFNHIKLPSTVEPHQGETKSILETLPIEFNHMTSPDLFKHIAVFRNIERISLRGNEFNSFSDANEIVDLLPKLTTIIMSTNANITAWVEDNKEVFIENNISILF